MSTEISVMVNGDALSLEAGTSVAALVEKLALTGRRLAVELNEEIVPKSQHAQTILSEGDRLEIVHAIGGG